MALDAYGNYYCNLPAEYPGRGTGGSGNSIQRGAGAPTTTTLISYGYIDSNNGNFYVNDSGTNTGWVLISGSGGGGNLSGSSSPVGSATPTSIGQTYTQESGGVFNSFWVSTGLTNMSWTQLV